MSTIHEECGVFGIFAPQRQDVASTAYYALFALQHRGQESAGIAVGDGSHYDPSTEGFIRFNIGCARSVLQKGLEAMERCYKDLVK